MASSTSDPLWWFTPLQIATTVIAGANCGASALHSPLTWPMLQEGLDIPIQYVGRQTQNLLHGSEFIFPPFNAFCTLGNLVMVGVSYYHPRGAVGGSAKADNIRLFAIAAGFHVATTVYTLAVMAPYNRRLVRLSKELNAGVDKGEEKSEAQSRTAEEFRDAQKIWKFRNYGRGAIMLASVVTSAIALAA